MSTPPPFSLRPYQTDAVQAVIRHFRGSHEPAVVVLPTGAGKSLVIAELARLARGRVLVLAHVRELVEQNQAKYEAYGLKADVFSAGLGRKEALRQVVFGSVQSVVRHLDQFDDAGFTLLVIDECHRVDCRQEASYQQVIRHLQQLNPNLKILGLTATPYRLGQGFIYHRHLVQQAVRGRDDCFFRVCVSELPLRWMVRQGYLVMPDKRDMPIEGYDFSTLYGHGDGAFREAELAQVVDGSRVTPTIVSNILQQAQGRQGIMIFCATVRHAQEVTALLPAAETALVTGQTPSETREFIIQQFKARRLRFLVNVSVLTTGFDAPHVDVIAILRPTESVSLYQQIIGRGLRLSPETGKQDCLILDYAGNPWDLWAPEIGPPPGEKKTVPVQIPCPLCGFANTFWGRVDSQGHVLEHFGRRCQGWDDAIQAQCVYRFRSRQCEQCGGECDIAARNCPHCDATLVDPDDKLKAAMKLKGARVLRVAGMTLMATVNGRGHPRLKVTYYDEEGEGLDEWFALETSPQRRAFEHHFLKHHLKAPGVPWRPQSPDAVQAEANRLRYPDFVIARQVGRHWRIQEKLFDYQGRFRKAVSAGPDE